MKKIISIILTGVILSSQVVAMAAGELNKESIMEEANRLMAQKDTYIDSLGMTFGEAAAELSKLSEQYYNAGSDEEKDSIFTQMDTIYKALNTIIEYSGSDYAQIAYERKLEAEENEKKEQNNEFAKILQKFMGYSQKSGAALMGVEQHTIYPDGTETVVNFLISDEDKKEIIRLLNDIIDNDYLKIASKENLRQFSYDVHFMEVNLTQMNENGVYDEVLTKIQEVREILIPDNSNTNAEEITNSTDNSKLNNTDKKRFWDVKPENWYYDSVMKMTQMGYFAGKGTNANGEATFAPNDTMTKAEFLTVVARILYDEDNLKGVDGDAWWSVYHTALVNGGVITLDEFKIEDMEKPMTRQEMSLVAVRALEQRGETLDAVSPYVKSAIPDYNSIGTFYRNNVTKGYQLGLLCGVDNNGTFNPQGSLNRAEATMVLYRIVEPSARIQKDFSKPVTTPSSVVGQQIIHEGEQSKRVPAKEGDIFIKKDGTQVVLKKGPNGVVGEGQGVAPDIGMYGTNGGYVISSNEWENQLMLGLIDEGLYPYFRNAKGESLNNNTYRVNATTGEGHWSTDWSIIMDSVDRPQYDGSYHGEVSKDAYSMYAWNDIVGMWIGNFAY